MAFGRNRPPLWYWAVAILLLLWGLAGVAACAQQLRLGADAMGPADDHYRALYAALPVWYNWVYAVATLAGLGGAILLLLRRATARTMFVISLIAVLIQFGWLFATTDIVAVRGAGATLPFPIFIAAVALFQIWFASLALRRGWIG
ncbi:hypothetical protein [Sphingomonas sp. RS2018]